MSTTFLRIIKPLNPTGYVDLFVADCLIDYEPEIKWQVEKKNAFDTSLVHRRKPYHDDTISCTAPLNPAQTADLAAFIGDNATLYVQFDLGNTTITLPATVDKMPKWDDDAREWTALIKFTFNASYTEPYTPPAFGNISGWGVNWGDDWGW